MTKTTTALTDIQKETKAFIVSDKSQLEQLPQLYEEAGFIYASKLAKIALHGFNFFDGDNLVDWAISKIDQVCQETWVERLDHLTIFEGELNLFHCVYLGSNKQQTNEYAYVDKYKTKSNPSSYKNEVFDPNAYAQIIGKITDNKELRTIITKDNLKEYHEVPPIKILPKIAEARKLNLFDDYVVFDIHNTVVDITPPLYDPIICGVLKEDPDRYYMIAGWDNNLPKDEILNQTLCSLDEGKNQLTKSNC